MRKLVKIIFLCMLCIWFPATVAGQVHQEADRPLRRVSAGVGFFMPSAFRLTYLSGEWLLYTRGETVVRMEVSGGWGSGWSVSFRPGGQVGTGILPPDRYYGMHAGLIWHTPVWIRHRWRMDLGGGLMAGYARTRQTILVDVQPIVSVSPPGYGWAITARNWFRHIGYPVVPVRCEISRRLSAGQEVSLMLTAYRSLGGYTPIVAMVGWSW